jgi:hypothetical protein
MIHEVWRSGLVRYHGYEWPPASTDVSAALFLAVGGSVYDWHGMDRNRVLVPSYMGLCM